MAVCRSSPIQSGPEQVSSLRLKNTPYMYINAGCGISTPNLRYNTLTAKWQFSNNGITWQDMGTGGTSGSYDDSVKLIELLSSNLVAESSHSLPGGASFTLASGSKLDVYYNGQLLTHDQATKSCDYTELTNTTLKFHFTMPEGTALAYVIK